MKNHRRAFLGLGTCSLLVALNGCDQGESEYDDGDFAQQSRAADDAPPCGHANDYNFECTVSEDKLKPWEPLEMDVPEDVRSKFDIWTTMSCEVVPEVLTADCKAPPPGCSYSPVKPPESGGVTRGDIVVAKEAVTIYRAYSAEPFECGVSSPAGSFGSWWTLTKPDQPKQEYRESVGICPAWNDLSMLATCKLAAGTVVLVGPTQSVSCEGTSTCDPAPDGWEDALPVTTAPQLFINSFGRPPEELDKFLLECTSEPWND